MGLEHISQFLAVNSQTIKNITNQVAKLQKNCLDLTLRIENKGQMGHDCCV